MSKFRIDGKEQDSSQNQVVQFRDTRTYQAKQRYSFGKIVRNSNERLRSNSRGTKSTHSEEGYRLSKFYIKNFFDKTDMIKNEGKEIQGQYNENVKIKALEGLSNQKQNSRRLHISKSLNHLQRFDIKKKSKLFNGSQEDTNLQALIQIKQLRRYLIHAEVAKNDIILQYRRQKDKIQEINNNNFNNEIKISQLERQNQKLKTELDFLRSSNKETRQNSQFKKALMKIQSLQKQLIQTKTQLCNAIQELNIMKKRYETEQYIRDYIREEKKHKLQQINIKYKQLMNRVQELKNQSPEQQVNIENNFNVKIKQKKVIFLEKCL